ncbi:MAG: secondary thiamine-phosphate synthase enzyme YjbQ [Bacteroidia bacterium]
MKISTQIIHFKTDGHTQMHDITAEINEVLEKSGLSEGQVCVFGIGSTTGITTVEFEPGLTKTDVREMFEKFAPYAKHYAHNATWGDDNGAAHLRSFPVGTSFNAPFVDGRLLLGTWQQIVFVDFDTRPRNRKIAVQVMGV